MWSGGTFANLHFKVHVYTYKPEPVLSDLHHNKVYFYDTSHVSVCAYCLLFCNWASLERAWLHLLNTLLSDIYTYR